MVIPGVSNSVPTIKKCDLDGKITYTTTSCPDGSEKTGEFKGYDTSRVETTLLAVESDPRKYTYKTAVIKGILKLDSYFNYGFNSGSYYSFLLIDDSSGGPAHVYAAKARSKELRRRLLASENNGLLGQYEIRLGYDGVYNGALSVHAELLKWQ